MLLLKNLENRRSFDLHGLGNSYQGSSIAPLVFLSVLKVLNILDLTEALMDFFFEHAIAYAMDECDLIHPGGKRLIEVFFEGFQLDSHLFRIAELVRIWMEFFDMEIDRSWRLFGRNGFWFGCDFPEFGIQTADVQLFGGLLHGK